ncbi:hypothetical protein [Emticicia sp. W12TSBA100-4]|uniref:hypothetical protein n=1 Tax=Emticicia sp. W12TSBA100-4 TaxID=3160965 RepID=UPI003305817A
MTAVSKTTQGTSIAQNSDVQTLEPSIIQPVQSTPQLTVHEVLEMLNQGNQKKALFDDFSKRVQFIENFKQKHEGGTLKMLIMNSEDDEEVTIANVEIITEALDKSIQKGREYLSKVEKELLSIF